MLAPGADKVMDGFVTPDTSSTLKALTYRCRDGRACAPTSRFPFSGRATLNVRPGSLSSAEFLDLTGKDPSVPCINKMRAAIDPKDKGPIFVYYATDEKTRTKDLAERHPKYSALLENYIGRLVDLWPLVRKYYYHPRMEGSFQASRKCCR